MKNYNPFQQIFDSLSEISSLLIAILRIVKEGEKKKPKDSYMTRTEVSEYLKVTRQTLGKWHQEGKLKATCIGSHYRYKKAVVDEFMRTHS